MGGTIDASTENIRAVGQDDRSAAWSFFQDRATEMLVSTRAQISDIMAAQAVAATSAL